MAAGKAEMEKIVALCKRRGFIFQSSEIYGGIGGFWDYGPLGTELKRNIKNAWWNDMVLNPPLGPGGREFQMVGVDCSIIMNPKVWEASGHVGGFSDPMVDCKECKGRFRADTLYSIQVHRSNTIEGFDEFFEPSAKPAPTNMSLDNKNLYGIIGGTMETDSLEEAANLAENTVREFAKKNNLAPFKKFEIEMGATDESARRVYVRGRDGKGESYECFVLGGDGLITWNSCPRCQSPNSLTEPREFNLMFQTFVGAVQDDSSVAYLRPETAQGIFANFKNVMDSSRVKIPFGIAQIGKAFRNEINPRNFTFRSREFEQMEIEFFCHPSESMEWYEFWRDTRINWYTSLNIKSDKLRPRQQEGDELAHYSKACTDIEYLFPFSEETQELEGVAHRGCYDLEAHGEAAKGKKNAFAVIDDTTKERYVPHVIEPSAGADRFTLATICEAYSYDENRASPEFMCFHPRLAPIKAAVFPLVAKDGMPEIAEPIYREIKKHYPAQYDAKQSIGKRYARMDEAGTPFCFTIDGQSKEDGTVTVRNRDDASQIRIDKSRCLEYLRDQLGL